MSRILSRQGNQVQRHLGLFSFMGVYIRLYLTYRTRSASI